MGFQQGNKLAAGSRKHQLVSDAITRAIKQDDGKRIRQGVEKLLDLAATGDLPALTYIRDTIQGRPSQQLTLDGDDVPVITAIRMVIVSANQGQVIEQENSLPLLAK